MVERVGEGERRNRGERGEAKGVEEKAKGWGRRMRWESGGILEKVNGKV